MAVNIQEMSRVTGVDAKRLEETLNIRTQIGNFEEACEVYQAQNGKSYLTRVSFDKLKEYTETFPQALVAYKVTQKNRSNRREILAKALKLISSEKEIFEKEINALCEITRPYPVDQNYVLWNVTRFF